VQVLEDIPDDLKGKVDSKGEASLKGHLKNGEDEKTGSQVYVPPDPKDDKQLIAAEDLLRGVNRAANTPPAAPAAKSPAPADSTPTPPASSDEQKEKVPN
jgi:carboxyl-terminal processing protease